MDANSKIIEDGQFRSNFGENRLGIKDKEDQINCILYQFYDTFDV
jgi:hypothetical protein